MTEKRKKLDRVPTNLKGSSGKYDIGDLWEDQRKFGEKSALNKQEYIEAKEKLRKARKEVYKEFITPDIADNKTIKILRNLKSWVKGFLKSSLRSYQGKPKRVKVGIVAILAAVIFGLILIQTTGGPNQTSTVGGSTVINGSSSAPELPREDSDSTKFDLLYRSGIDPKLYDVALVSPDGAEPAYTYLDRFTGDGVVFRVTQQEIPNNFDLASTADDFQLADVIQVDSSRIYHGYSEKGRTQSLIFIKDKLLVTIRSPEKFSDELWANYYLSLE